jgi:two-component system KDP operon response regulator KdpE
MSPERILIADRELKMVRLVREVLKSAGYIVLVAHKAEQAVQMAAKEQPDLIILEVDLAGETNGFEVTRRIRQFSDVPVLILTTRGESEDVLHGFAVGADDYVTKPFDPKILVARVRAILRRCQAKEMSPAEIVCDHLAIDLAARRVTVDGSEIYLTETEYNLLVELARHRNRVLMHDQLLDAVWGPKFRNEIDYLRSYIHILRRKLESDPAQPRLIISRPGVGYMLVAAQDRRAGG